MTIKAPEAITLLPCPFCGGTPKPRSSQVAEDVTETWVECANCQVQTDRIEGAYSDHPTAAQFWNRRPPTLQPSLERTERELREARERVQQLESRLAADEQHFRGLDLGARSAIETENQRLREALERVERELRRMVCNRHDVSLYQIREMHEWTKAALSNPSNPEKGES
jgi:septal ring factor EnvC (AmiA/AmiB activator)